MHVASLKEIVQKLYFYKRFSFFFEMEARKSKFTGELIQKASCSPLLLLKNKSRFVGLSKKLLAFHRYQFINLRNVSAQDQRKKFVFSQLLLFYQKITEVKKIKTPNQIKIIFYFSPPCLFVILNATHEKQAHNSCFFPLQKDQGRVQVFLSQSFLGFRRKQTSQAEALYTSRK